jgi:hypothetical protein
VAGDGRTESDEGARLLDDGNVELIGPEGASLGRVRIEQAYRTLRSRLLERLAEEEQPPQRGEIQAGLDRLDARAQRLKASPGEKERST